MDKAFVINAHQPYPFAPGNLNRALAERITAYLEAGGYETRHTTMASDYNVEEELEKHRWADLIILQTPVNWMGVPWSFKKYMDDVYSAGMGGQLCVNDGRSSDTPKKGYGTGGVLTDTRYMLSLTFNAPAEAFDDPNEWLFEGRGVDDLFWPMHLNFKFFGMSPLPTFACFDVMKNPEIEADFARLEHHLNKHIPLNQRRAVASG
ncbi:MAG: NAD(P)H-dependent oxidoreductase [Candidatus Competibacteraceae bacterium]|jgi:modulator of drug activity B|nr:NAD(P)H-dependent oxidoreductase [Candidatus Competibacteraceae bacterium]